MAVLRNITLNDGNLTGGGESFDSAVIDGGDLHVSPDAAMGGTWYGLQCDINDTTGIYGVVLLTDPGTGKLRFGFEIDPNSLTMANGDLFYVCRLNSVGSLTNVYLYYTVADGHQILFEQRDDSGFIGNIITPITDEVHYIETYIQQAATDVSSDGSYTWWIDGVQIATLSGLDIYDIFAGITSFHFGAVAAIDVGTSGTFYLDEFTANDDGSEIGPINTYATARPMTNADTASIRTDGQYTKVRAVIIPQQTVLACKSSGSLISNDAVTAVPINAITGGSTASIQNGMTCYVGSGSGLSDLGMVRVKSFSGSQLNIARKSGIDWQSDTHLTVVDDFGLWAKLPTLDLTTIEMDDDIAYTDQNTDMSPVPVFGPDRVFPYASGSMVLNGANSWCPDGTAVTGWNWSLTNGSAVAGSIVASGSSVTTWAFTEAGSYILSLAVTSSNGKTTTGRRNVYLYDDADYAPIEQLTLGDMNASRENGGWTAQVELWADANLTGLRDRAKIILMATDYYSGSALSMGQVPGSEEVLFVGWVSNETTDYTKEFSTVNVTLSGPAWWLQKCTGPSTFLESITTTPTAWTEIQNLTMDLVMHHFLYWRSTAIEIMDVYPSSGSRVIGGMSASIGSIWSQMNDTATTRMLTILACDRYGRFFSYLDPQLIPEADRAAIPTIYEVTQDDLAETVTIPRTIVNPVALLEVAGLATSGSNVLMYMSRAPGSLIYNRWGDNSLNDRLVVSSQSDANALSGMLLAKKNNEYENVSMVLGQNNKMIDIAPAEYVTFTVEPDDTIRGFSFTEKKFLISGIQYQVDSETGAVMSSLTCEGYTFGDPGYTVILPQEPIYNFPPTPEVPPITFPVLPIPTIPPIITNPTPFIPPPWAISGSCVLNAPENGPYTLGIAALELYNQAPQNFVRSPLGGSDEYKIRSGSAVNLTRYEIWGEFEDWTEASGSKETNTHSGSGVYTAATDWYTVYGVNSSGSRIATATNDAAVFTGVRTGYFDPAAAVDIAYIDIELADSDFNPTTIEAYQGLPTSGSGIITTWAANNRAVWSQSEIFWHGFNYEPRTGGTLTPYGIQFTSGSEVYVGENFHCTITAQLRYAKDGSVKETPLKPAEEAAPSKPYFDTYRFLVGRKSGVVSNSFGPRTSPGVDYSIYYTSESFVFTNPSDSPSPDNNSIFIELNFQAKPATVLADQKLYLDEYKIMLTPAASKRMKIDRVDIYNLCEAT